MVHDWYLLFFCLSVYSGFSLIVSDNSKKRDLNNAYSSSFPSPIVSKLLIVLHFLSLSHQPMAINMCSSDKSGPGMSPRISFSHDPKNTVPLEEGPDQDTSSDFVFCITNAQKLSSADELFSNGKILPTQINSRLVSIPNSNYAPRHHHPQQQQRKKMLKEFLSEPDEDDIIDIIIEEEEEMRPSNSVKLFWRSSSVNCDGATRGKSMLRSSLQFLSRSYSTGSAPNTPKHHAVNVIPRHKLAKQSSASSFSLSSSSSTSSGAYYFYDSCQKNPSLKKNFSGNNGVRISPILNLPHHKATRSIFGFGSLFCNGKIKRKKK